jgi:hypothetical protein
MAFSLYRRPPLKKAKEPRTMMSLKRTLRGRRNHDENTRRSARGRRTHDRLQFDSLEERKLLSCAVPDDAAWASVEGGCKDLQTALVWSLPGAGGSGNYSYAKSSADTLVEGGFGDWRMPTKSEMQTAATHDTRNHQFHGVAPGAPWWSGTDIKGSKAWAVTLGIGLTFQYDETGAYLGLVRVRDGSSSSLIDDGSPGYSDTVSGWTAISGNGLNDDYRSHAKGSGSAKATWDFSGLAAGSYQVQATWPALSTSARDAKYKIFNGAVLQQTVQVNQRQQAADALESRGWKTLGTFSITSSTLKVELGNNANGNVIADAIKLIPVGGAVAAATSVRDPVSRDSVAAGIDLALDRYYTDDRDDRDDSEPASHLSARSLTELLRTRSRR